MHLLRIIMRGFTLLLVLFSANVTARIDAVLCPAPIQPDNGMYNPEKNEYSYSDSVTFMCNEGFHVTGESTASCTSDGTWSTNSPNCKAISCGDPGEVMYANRSSSEFTYGSRVTYICQDGYKITSSISYRECQADGSWSPGDIVCSATCQVPEVANSQLKLGLERVYVENDVLVFECEKGYVLSGSSAITCNSQGQWDPSPPECKTNFCSPPPRLEYEVPKEEYLETTIFPEGSKVMYVCRLGYVRFQQIRTYATCMADTTWSLPNTFCKRRSCGNPGDLDNGQFQAESFDFGSRVTYVCNPGYIMESKRNYRDCQADGKWSNALPECTVLSCPSPPHTANGHYYPEKDEYTYLDSVKYVCSGNLALIGEQTISCTEEGKWSFNAPECKAVQCPYPNVDNAVKLSGFSGPYNMDYAVRFRCGASYKLIGSDTVKCNQSSKWEPELPKCLGICYSVPNFPYAELVEATTNKSFLEGTTLQFKCKKGYEPIPDAVNTVTCIGLRWSFREFCKPITCVEPETVTYGRIISGSFLYGNRITYGCEIGYKIKSIAYRTCQSDRSWSLPIPECEVQTCDTPLNIRNGWYGPIMEEYRYNDTITYMCNTGFKLVGPASRSCHNDGRWNNYTPECRGICVDPPDLDYAQLDPRYENITSFFSGKTVRYNCRPGYSLGGLYRNVIVCLGNFTWSIPNKFCNRTSCGPPPKVENAVFEAKYFLFESEATYKCEKGYKMVSQSDSVKCGYYGRWIGALPVCEVQKCLPPEELKDGSYSLKKDMYTYNESVIYKCNTLQLVGRASVSCAEEGKWSSGAPQCRAVCTCPPELDFAVVEEEYFQQEFFERGTSMQYKCRQGFLPVTGKNNTLICLNDLKWSQHEIFCSPISCGNPGDIDHGHLQSENFFFGSTVNYTCNSGYSMVSKRNYRKCQADGTWSGKPPVCKETVCDQIWELQEEARQCTSNPDEWIKYLQVQYLYLQIENMKLDIEIKKRQLDALAQTSNTG